jgi:PKD repeat protein
VETGDLRRQFYTILLLMLIFQCGLTFGCVPNKPPIPDFTYSPSKPHVCEIVTFNASASYDPDGSIVAYEWDFGDGNKTKISQPIVEYHYVLPGVYNVTLTVSDAGGLKNSTWKEITVTKPPVAFFTFVPLHPKVNSEVIFNASESKPDGGYIIAYLWDFGDGIIENSTDPIIVHVYSAFGDYLVKLTVVDSEGEEATATDIVTVISPPTADFFFQPLQPRVCDIVVFNASNSVPNGGFIIEYLWDFGDGSELEFGMVVQHKFRKIGEYVVCLNVTDSEGEWSTKEVTLKILPSRADLNEDGRVDIYDLYLLCRAYGSYPDHERWNAAADMNGDGKVNIIDAALIAKSFCQCSDA